MNFNWTTITSFYQYRKLYNIESVKPQPYGKMINTDWCMTCIGNKIENL